MHIINTNIWDKATAEEYQINWNPMMGSYIDSPKPTATECSTYFKTWHGTRWKDIDLQCISVTGKHYNTGIVGNFIEDKEIKKLKKKNNENMHINFLGFDMYGINEIRNKLIELDQLAYKRNYRTYTTTWKDEAEKWEMKFNNRTENYQAQKDSYITSLNKKHEASLKSYSNYNDSLIEKNNELSDELIKLKKEIDTSKGISTYEITLENYNRTIKADDYYEHDDFTIYTLDDEVVFRIRTSLIQTIDVR